MGIINFSNKSNTTNVENDFIINHMQNIPGDFVKIYLYMLMLNNSGCGISIDEIADRFGIFSSEIIKALEVLSKEGCCVFAKDGENYSLSFDKPHADKVNANININTNTSMPLGMSFDNSSYIVPNMNMNENGQMMFSESYAKTNDITKDNVLNFTNNVNNNDYMNNTVSFSDDDTIYDAVNKKDKSNTSYTAEELAFLLQENDEVNDLKKYIEKLYGQTMDSKNLESLVSICSMEYVPTNTLKNIVQYINANIPKIQKFSPLLNALEKKAIEINENGLTTEDDINDYLMNTSENYRTILKRFGIMGRNVAPYEKAFIDRWLYDYKVNMDVILEACDKTIRATNQPSFPYCEEIIKNYKVTNTGLNKQSTTTPVKPNTFSNINKKSSFDNYTKQTNNLNQFEMDNMTKLMNKYGNN